mmetsp:Transcript_2535/g.7436  ORF Transcript_2535/g.7436 Transcript_2535/m.7436 type:complete len:207 (-) Transcript_2535:90-710(-)
MAMFSSNIISSGRIRHKSSNTGGSRSKTPARSRNSSTARGSMVPSDLLPRFSNEGQCATTVPLQMAIRAGKSDSGRRRGSSRWAKSASKSSAGRPLPLKNLVPRYVPAILGPSRNRSRLADISLSGSYRCRITAGATVADMLRWSIPNPVARRTRLGCICRCAPKPCWTAASRSITVISSSARRASSRRAMADGCPSSPGRSSSSR